MSLPDTYAFTATAADLAVPMPAFTPAKTCSDVFDWFNRYPAQVAAAIVDGDGKVTGIVNRLRFLARYAQRYVPELYGPRSIAKMANAKPLIVDERVSVVELGTMLALEWPDALRECFVVTCEDRYLGIGTSEALVRCKVEMLTRREMQLHAALLSATDASKAKSNFLALMSHELRTPLNAILGFSEVLANELFGPLGAKRYREYAGDIHKAGQHLLALINDILDLSKTEAGKLDLYPENIDLPALFADCQNLVLGRAQDRGVHLTIRVSDTLPMLHADALRIKQVLLNLLSNAIKFTPAGGSVEAAADIRPDGGLLLSVSDTGIGMAPEMIPIALEPFRQIASPFARTIEGTGLGLSLVKSLIERHGGTIAIQSAPNQGTCVHLNLPASCSVWREAAMAV